jgi:hypothetical protein
MAYTAIDDSSAYFQQEIYTGTGEAKTVTNTGNSDLQPAWLWQKNVSNSQDGRIFDSVRGGSKILYPSLTNAEASDNQLITSFNSDGFTMGSSGTNVNDDGTTNIAWQWATGTAFSNDASSTSVGNIDSAGSVSTTSGFSIISYTGTGSATTFAHGLGAVPKMIIFKNRTAAGSQWDTYHNGIGTAHRLYLDDTSAKSSATNFINNTAPTSSVITVGDATHTNGNGNSHIAYCFTDIKGFSKFGSYVGNGDANGTFVHTGFKPAFLLGKHTGIAGQHWFMNDSARGYNGGSHWLKADASDAQLTNLVAPDFLSNGFKLRNNNDIYNDATHTYIYMAFAENPFVTSTGIPTTAK